METPLLFVKLGTLAKEFSFETVYAPEGWEETKIITSEVNRPGLELSGFFDHFDNLRLQLIGNVEYDYLNKLPAAER